MANAQKLVTIVLTLQQQQSVQVQTGAVVTEVELLVETLEERTSPRCIVVSKDAMTPK